MVSHSFTHGLSQPNPLPYSTRGASLPPRSSADFSYGSLRRFLIRHKIHVICKFHVVLPKNACSVARVPPRIRLVFLVLTPCRSALFAPGHYIRHVNESRLSWELGSARTTCARHEFMFTHALQNCCFDPGHYVNESRVSREFGSAQTTCACNEFWPLSPCRTSLFALCHYIRHVNESRVSWDLAIFGH